MRELTIGEFAVQTGLTQRALRLYDERGVLVPAATDPVNGYRRYAPSQIRTGHLVRALRGAGVPMAELVDLDSFSIADHRERLRRQREDEDIALATAEMIDGFEPDRWPVEVRDADAQPWVGLRLVADRSEDGGSDEALAALEDTEAVNTCFAGMFTWLERHDARPTGSWWSAIGAGADDQVTFTLCWPVPHELSPDQVTALGEAGRASAPPELAERLQVASGVLPQRRELVCRVDQVEEDASQADHVAAALGPALALEAYETDHGLSALGRTVRQVGSSQGTGVEMVLDVEPA